MWPCTQPPEVMSGHDCCKYVAWSWLTPRPNKNCLSYTGGRQESCSCQPRSIWTTRRLSDVSWEERALVPIWGKGKGYISSLCPCSFPCPIPAGPSAGSRTSDSKSISAAAAGNGACVYPSTVTAFIRFAMSSPATGTIAVAPSAPQALARESPTPLPQSLKAEHSFPKQLWYLGPHSFSCKGPWMGLLWKELTSFQWIQPSCFFNYNLVLIMYISCYLNKQWGISNRETMRMKML